MYRIAIIIPYFGKLPNYFPLFLESCRRNPTVNWLFFTDTQEPYEWPENVQVISMSFSEFRVLVQARYDFPISLDRPYKLCDYRPAYGELLQDYIRGYDFWGYGDCDLIYGNIRRFLTDEVLGAYEKVLTRGHLSLYRNLLSVNQFYRRQTSCSYREVLSSPETCTFDEWSGISGVWAKSGKPYYDALCYDDLWVGLKAFHTTKEIPGFLSGPYNNGQRDESAHYRTMKHIAYRYEAGELERLSIQNGVFQKEPVLYVHLQKRAMEISPEILPGEPGGFWIVPNRFIPQQPACGESLRNCSPRGTLLQDGRTMARYYAAQTVRGLLANLRGR